MWFQQFRTALVCLQSTVQLPTYVYLHLPTYLGRQAIDDKIIIACIGQTLERQRPCHETGFWRSLLESTWLVWAASAV